MIAVDQNQARIERIENGARTASSHPIPGIVCQCPIACHSLDEFAQQLLKGRDRWAGPSASQYIPGCRAHGPKN